jgi:DNA-binding response OmpR family regulator
VVDDEASLRIVLESSLTNAGYTVGTAAEGVAALEYVATERPDLVLLDLMLPGDDGFAVVQQLRDFTAVPIMMLTASSDEQHIVRALQLGADDYLVKPFGMDELMARIEALLRRAGGATDNREPAVIGAGDLSIDLARRAVRLNGSPVELTPIEYRLLAYLARHTGQVLTHEQILRHVWGAEYGGESQYLWVHMGRLRQKIEADPKQPRHILTERGTGYRFEI